MNRLEKLKKEIKDKVKLLWDSAEEIIIPLDEKRITHHRYFLVDLYKENTETSGCLGFLAQISKWFNVRPLTRDQVSSMTISGYQPTPEELKRIWNLPENQKLLAQLIKEFGEYKKVVDYVSGVAYKVPTKDIITKGLKQQELDKYPVWGDENVAVQEKK